MTIEEIREEVFEKVAKNEDLKCIRKDFYEALGAVQLQFAYNGCNLQLISPALTPGYGRDAPIKTISFDPANPSQFVKALQEYTDKLNTIESEWNAIVRNATIVAKVKGISKMAFTSILQSAFEDQDVTFNVIMPKEGGNADISIMSDAFYMSLNLPTNHPQTMPMLQTLGEKVKSASIYCAGEKTTTKDFVERQLDKYGQVLNWFSRDSTYINDEEINRRHDIYNTVVAAGRNMDFQPVPSNKEQLLAALTDAGVHAEMVTSPYCHTQQDIKVTQGELSIIITNGKTYGMLVACSPFFVAEDKEIINICVSHSPMDQVVQWMKDTCEKLSPIANELIPVYRVLAPRKRDIPQAMGLMRDISFLSKVSGDINEYDRCNCKLTINGIGTLEMRDVDIQTTDPIPFISAITEIVRYMTEMSAKINTTE